MINRFRNIWTLYLLVVAAGTVLLVLSLVARWQNILADRMSYHSARAELVARSVENLLRTQELVLDVIGRELLQQESGVLESSQQIPMLDSVLEVDSVLEGFGLARPDGQLVRVSSNLQLDRLPNLRKHPATRESFLLALELPVMVVGRTYYVEAMEAWVVPIRKALRRPDMGIAAVMTVGLRLGSGGTIFDQTLHDGDADSVILYRDSDGYVQFMSHAGIGPDQYSLLRRSEEERRQDIERARQQLGLSLEDIKARQRAVGLPLE